MNEAVRRHLHREIINSARITGGYTFNTWLLTLSDERKVIFRACRDFITGGGRKIIITDIFEREKFFYDTVNQSLGHVCPGVYVIDGTCEYYETPFQISEYLEGTPLDKCFDGFSPREKDEIFYQYGEMAARVNRLEINANHPYIKSRGPWVAFFTGRLRERLSALVKNGLITPGEIEKFAERMSKQKVEHTRSFLHIDMRFPNMIYNNKKIYLIDAENCEFGDPLFELAVISLSDNLTDAFMQGYTDAGGAAPDRDSELFCLYRMERLALVADVYLNEVEGENEMAEHYVKAFGGCVNKARGFS